MTGASPESPGRAAGQTARIALAAGIALALGALLVSGARAGGSAFVGGVVAALNAYVFTRTVGASLGRESSRWGRAWALLSPVKLVLFLALVGVLLVGRFVDPLPFLLGYAALPIALTLKMLREH